MNTNITVHHVGLEGSIQVNAQTGIVATPVDDRPTWADGLVCALLAERLSYYYGNEVLAPRVSREHWPEFGTTPIIAYQDLGWVALTNEGEQVEIEADLSYRQSLVAGALGLNLDPEAEVLEGAISVEAAIAGDVMRTTSEMEVIDSMAEVGFSPLPAETSKAINE